MAGDVEDARRCFEDLGEGRITEHLREGPFLTTLRFMLGLACLLIVLAMRLRGMLAAGGGTQCSICQDATSNCQLLPCGCSVRAMILSRFDSVTLAASLTMESTAMYTSRSSAWTARRYGSRRKGRKGRTRAARSAAR